MLLPLLLVSSFLFTLCYSFSFVLLLFLGMNRFPLFYCCVVLCVRMDTICHLKRKEGPSFLQSRYILQCSIQLPRKRERKFAQNDDCHSKVVFLNLFQIFFSFFYFYIYSIDLCTSSLYYENK